MTFHFPKFFAARHMGNDGKIVEGRRRRGGPFKRSSIPRISCQIEMLFSLFDADEDLMELRERSRRMRINPINDVM